jgi:hypothetical protein
VRKASKSVLPVVVGVAGAVLGVLAALLVHWFVIQPSDAELRDVAETLTPTGFTASHEPVVTGQWAPSLTRGVVHVDATSPSAVPLGEVADGLRADGWAVGDDMDAAADEGRLVAPRDGLVATVSLSPTPDGAGSTASISVGRGPQATSLTTATVGGALIGATVGSGTVLAIRRGRTRAGSAR